MYREYFSDRIQTTVRSRNSTKLDEIAETALEEESAIFSKNERHKQGANPGKLVCHNCGKMGHVAARCYLKDKKEARVNKLCTEMRQGVRKSSENRKSDIKCHNGGEMGHIARECRKPLNLKKRTQATSARAGDGPPERRAPSIGTVNSIGGGNRTKIECVKLQTDVSN